MNLMERHVLFRARSSRLLPVGRSLHAVQAAHLPVHILQQTESDSVLQSNLRSQSIHHRLCVSAKKRLLAPYPFLICRVIRIH